METPLLAEACSGQTSDVTERWEVPPETVLEEPHRVLRSSGTDRHYSISNARKLKSKAINASNKRAIKLEELRAQATNSSSEDDDVIQDVFF